MGNYTLSDNQTVDEIINSHLQLVIDGILQIIPTPTAIVLTGGFGRGEGTIDMNGGTAKPVNDYDLIVLTDEVTLDVEPQLKLLSKKLSKKIGIDFVDISILPNSQLKILPLTIFNYDLKYGSKIIYGDSRVLDNIVEYSPQEISLFEGMKLLFNRIAGILGGMNIDFFNRDLFFDEERYLKNQIVKSLIGCGDVLILLNGRYHHLYSKKREIFKSLFDNRVCPFLNRKEFELIDCAYGQKLYFGAQNTTKEVKVYLLEMIPLLRKVFIEYSRRYLNCASKDLIEIINAYIRFRTVKINSILKKGTKLLSLILSLGSRKISLWKHLWKMLNLPQQDMIYVTLPLVLFSLPYNNLQNEKYLQAAYNILACIKEVEILYPYKFSLDYWEILRRTSFRLWETHCHQ